MIECSSLSKEFHSFKKQPGIIGTLKSFYHRQYDVKLALNNFNLKIDRGEFIGILGPNGAGKTTLMKILSGIIVPTSGQAQILGFNPSERKIEFRKKIALVMGQKSQLWWDIPAMDSFQLLQKYYEIPAEKFNHRLKELSKMLEVEHVLHIHIRKLSLGERMKLELIACLLHDPSVIFLDEPTIGLDLVSQKNIRNFLLKYQKENSTTILLTSHYMVDVEALCSRIVLIFDGQKRYDGSILDFSKILGRDKFVTFIFEHPVDISDPFWNSLDTSWSNGGKQVELRISENELRKISSLIINKFEVIDFFTEKMPIERVMNTILTNPHLL